jgi:hypothetical protein
MHIHTHTHERRRHRRDTVSEPPRWHIESMILGTYGEMPGLNLSLRQASRLFGLQPTTCGLVMEDLVRRGKLRRSPDGQFLRGDGFR